MAVVSVKLQGPNVPHWARGEMTSWFWYYENCHREQWVARFDGQVLRIAGLDVGWKEIEVTLGEVNWELEQVRQQLVAGPLVKSWSNWILDTGELCWIASILETLALFRELRENSDLA